MKSIILWLQSNIIKKHDWMIALSHFLDSPIEVFKKRISTHNKVRILKDHFLSELRDIEKPALNK